MAAQPTGNSPPILPVDPDYLDYLRDESRLCGQAESISFPQEEEEAREILKVMAGKNLPVTIQGGRTGIAAGAVPRGGHILNLSRMNRFLGLRRDPAGGRFLLRLQPGVLLSEINDRLARTDLPVQGFSPESLRALQDLSSAGPFFFAPDPTEPSASIGGMAASNASGARSFFYGPTRRHIEALRLLLSDGSTLVLRRGGQRAEGRDFRLQCQEGRILAGRLPSYRQPATKNTAGLYARPDMELIDLIIGCEGTLGVLTELEVGLLPLPRLISALMAFFPRPEGALRFVRRLRGDSPDGSPKGAPPPGAESGPRPAAGGAAQGGPAALPKPAAIEFFDRTSLELLERQKSANPAFSELPALPGAGSGSLPAAAVYVEYHAAGPEAMEQGHMRLAEFLSECGADEDHTWLAEQPRDLGRLKEFRHALPEAINLLIDERCKVEPGIAKLGTDMAVPAQHLEKVFHLYRRDLQASGLQYALFGHIGDSHLHVNILPRTLEDYEQGRRLYEGWAEQVVALGGSVSAEHGIGKLKVELLRRMYGQAVMAEMRRVIEIFNPEARLNRGNIVG